MADGGHGRLEGFRARNFGPLRDVALGRLEDGRRGAALTPVTAVIGRNGTGKRALLDAFRFLADCIKAGVEEACDAAGRGGFSRLRSQGEEGPIGFQLRYRERGNARPLSYEIAIDADGSGRPRVVRERLRQRRRGGGRLFSFLALDDGGGRVWAGDLPGVDEGGNPTEGSGEGEPVALTDRRRPGIAVLGAMERHPRISGLRRFIEDCHLSSFTPEAARGLPPAAPRARLDPHGDNLANVVRFMERGHPGRFRKIAKAMAERIPGVDRIETETTADGRLLLGFNDRGFQDPFYARQVSDGTLKTLALLLLLEGPAPPSLVCVRQPEDGLHHKLLGFLANEFRRRAAGRRCGPQVFMTTHQPYLVDALDPEEVWILEKGEDGFSTARRASDNALVVEMVAEDLPLGGLWYSEYLESGSAFWTETV